MARGLDQLGCTGLACSAGTLACDRGVAAGRVKESWRVAARLDGDVSPTAGALMVAVRDRLLSFLPITINEPDGAAFPASPE